MIVLNGWKPLTIIMKSFILDVAAVLDPSVDLFLAPLTAPEITAAFSHSPSTIFIEWDHIPQSHWNGESLGYKIKYKKFHDVVFQEKILDFKFKATHLEGLKPFTLYWIDICAFNSAGEGPVSWSIKKTLEGGNLVRFSLNIFLLKLSIAAKYLLLNSVMIAKD